MEKAVCFAGCFFPVFSPVHFSEIVYLIPTKLLVYSSRIIPSKKGGIHLNITSKGRYALRVMLDLAQHPEDGFVSLKTVAERQDISMKYLESIVGSLKKAELLESTRGKEGGYRLSKPPAAYTVEEILRSIEDKLAPVSCIKEGSIQCERASACLTIPMWMELDEITNAYLKTVTLEDLLTGQKWKSRSAVP